MLPITVNIKNGPSLELTDENLAGFYTPPIEKETNLLAEFLFPALVRQRFLEAAARQPVTVILRDPETGILRHVEIIEPLVERAADLRVAHFKASASSGSARFRNPRVHSRVSRTTGP